MTRAEYRRWVAARSESRAVVPEAEVASVEPIEAVGSVQAVESVEFVEPVAAVASRATAEPVESVEAVGPVEGAESVESVEDAASRATVEPVESPSVALRPSLFGAVEEEPLSARPKPADADAAESEPAREPEPAEDVFEAAARLFAFARESEPVETPAEPARPIVVAPLFEVPPHAATVPVMSPREQAVRIAKRVAAGSLSLGAMTVVGLLAFSTVVPSSAIASPPSADVNAAVSTSAKAPKEIQAFVATDVPIAEDLDRPDVYGVISMSEIAAESGVTRFAGTWVNNLTAEVQWPFPVGVPISAGFGSAEYAAQFGTTHNGADFTPGGGAEIHAVAAGTVRIATESGDAYGVTVVIDHVINGETVSTRYAHMQYGSLQVSQGEVVEVGQVIGKVGSTGKSTGDHLHLEVLLGGTTPTDPIAWIQQHTS